MPKPQEVLVNSAASGFVKQDVMEETVNVQLFKNMKETLCNFSLINWADMENIFKDEVNGLSISTSNRSEKRVNSLCWAIGTVSGKLPIQAERKYVTKILKVK